MLPEALNWVDMPPVDPLDAGVVGQEHPMSAAEVVVGQKSGEVRIDVDHHRGNALLAWPRGPAVDGLAEPAVQGGLQSGPVQDLATSQQQPPFEWFDGDDVNAEIRTVGLRPVLVHEL